MDSEQLLRLVHVCNMVLLFGAVLSPAPIGWAYMERLTYWPEKHWLSLISATLWAAVMLVASIWRVYAWVTWGM